MLQYISKKVNLRLFFSVDVKDSVSIKSESNRLMTLLHKALGLIESQEFEKIDSGVKSNLNRNGGRTNKHFISQFNDEIKKNKSNFNIEIEEWKRLGDEIVFSAKVDLGIVEIEEEEVLYNKCGEYIDFIESFIDSSCISIHNSNALREQVNNILSDKNVFGHLEIQPKILVKGAVWSCFTREFTDNKDDYNYEDFISTLNKLRSQKKEVLSDNFEIKQNGYIEIIGPGMDYGFRIARNSQVCRFVIGKHLVDIFVKSERYKFDEDGGFSLQTNKLYVNAIGAVELKGFMRVQPVFTALSRSFTINEKHYNDYKRVIGNTIKSTKIDYKGNESSFILLPAILKNTRLTSSFSE